MKLYHGTARALGIIAENDGLNPTGCESVSEEFRKSRCSEPGYVYFFEDKEDAVTFACGTAFKVGLGMQGEIFEINSEDVSVEKDPLLPYGSWRHEGSVAHDKLKTAETIDCEKIGQGRKFWEKRFKNW